MQATLALERVAQKSHTYVFFGAFVAPVAVFGTNLGALELPSAVDFWFFSVLKSIGRE